jgi:hypothetical protein
VKEQVVEEREDLTVDAIAVEMVAVGTTVPMTMTKG